MRFRLLTWNAACAALLLALTASFSACGNPSPAAPETPTTPQDTIVSDPHSHAQPQAAVVTHLDLDIAVDFATKTLGGTATWQFTAAPGARTLTLDAFGLAIQSVKDAKTGRQLSYDLGPEQPWLGQALAITLEEGTQSVAIEYATTQRAEGLQWLEPAQTAGKKEPFLFSQSQAILARTWLPCQDSPGIRFTYTAKVKVPPHLLAVMSATNPTERNAEGMYSFRMDQRIPAYLMAIAVGDVQFKPLSPRTGVYAEPAMLEKTAWEFADMEKMVQAAEALYGAYRWERYDVIVLPPSFPFGGMENPRLTFATPTVIAGDRSLTSLVAHELAHSWSGNLVTNATWNDFWLNEGFTVYFEKRIMESLYGKDYVDMMSVLAWQELQLEIEEKTKENAEDTHLYLKLAGRNPDDGMSTIAYDKGCFLLETIEHEVGREKWDAFLRGYFDSHAFQSMTTGKFIAYLKSNLEPSPDWDGHILLDKWIHGPGMPANFKAPTSARLQVVDKAIEGWKAGQLPAGAVTQPWTTHEWLYFIRGLGDSLSHDQIRRVDAAYNFSNSGNAEILGAWFPHVIRANYRASFPQLAIFLGTVGRRKFVRPLYKELVRTPEGKAWAMERFAQDRNGYHAVTANSVAELLGMEK